MSTSEHGMPLGNHSTHSPSSSPPPPSDDPILYNEDDVPEILSEQESAFLDHGITILDQEYDYQRQLVDHYSKSRRQPSNTGYYLPHGIDGTSRSSRPHTYDTTHGRSRPPPPIYTGTDGGAMMDKGYPRSHNDAYAYQHSKHQRPLIDLITNQWRTSISPPRSPAAPSFFQIVTAPRFRRYLAMIFMFFFFPWFSWKWYGRPQWDEHRLLNDALDEKLRTGAAWYGLNMRPTFTDMTQVGEVHRSQLPQGVGEKRLVFIGDVHGCYEELSSLLAEVKYNNQTDHIIFAGDLISKGPASPDVVNFALAQQASCVRGNHEDRILLAYRDLNARRLALPGPDEDQDDVDQGPPAPGGPITDSLDEESFSHGDYIDRRFAKSLTSEQASYLASCPIILDVGHVPGMGRMLAVHAGLVPGIELDNQDPIGVMNMRTVDLKTHVPSRGASGTPWYKLWNKYQAHLPAAQRSTVVYAHDSRRSLQLQTYSKGLDTGCVEGGKLTALILTVEDGKNARQQVVGVQCKDHRGLMGKNKGWDDLPFMQIKEDNHGGSGTGQF
ncbi:MAG: hypothetical protein Q9222_001999 [Ikaeria aurantiellina]